MTSTVKRLSTVSKRYAGALIDLALEQKNLPKIEKDMDALGAMVEHSDDFRQFLASPLIGKAKQAEALSAITKKSKLQKTTENFLAVLIQNGRLGALPQIVTAFKADAAIRRGELSVQVTVAQDMSAKQAKALQDALKNSVGADVTLNITVEPAIMGGMIVTVGSHMIDDSVARKLERLKTAMAKRSNENVIVNITKKEKA